MRVAIYTKLFTLERLRAGDVSRRRVAKELNIGYASLNRLLDAESY